MFGMYSMTMWRKVDIDIPWWHLGKLLPTLFARSKTKIVWWEKDTNIKAQRILGEKQGEERGEGMRRGYESERRERMSRKREWWGRGWEERFICLPESHGSFLYQLPFPPMRPPPAFNGQIIRDKRTRVKTIKRENNEDPSVPKSDFCSALYKREQKTDRNTQRQVWPA